MHVFTGKWIIVLALLAAFALLAVACGGGDDEEGPFRVGVMESVTGPGETYGTVAVRAKELAVAEINAAGGINGRMLELVVEDSKCNAQDAITAYNKLTDVDGVKIILGTSCSGAMLGAAPLAEADGVVMFSGLATNPDIAAAGDYIFRTALNDAQLGIDTGNVLWADGIRTLATMTEATDYAEGVRRTSVAQFESLGGEVVAEERYASDVTDFRTQLTKLIGENPDAIHLAAQGEFAGGTIVKQLRELGYDGPIYSEVVPIGATALEIAGGAATGLKAVTADLDPANDKARGSAGQLPRASTTTSPSPGTSARPTTTSTSPPSAWGAPTTIRTRTASATASTTSPGAARSASITASTATARSSAWPTSWSRSCRSPSARRTIRATGSWDRRRRSRRDQGRRRAARGTPPPAEPRASRLTSGDTWRR